MRSPCMTQVGPRSNDNCPYTGQKQKRHRYTEDGAETGERWREPRPEAGRGKDQILPWKPQREHSPDDTLILDFWLPELQEWVSAVLRYQPVVICHSSPRKLTHTSRFPELSVTALTQAVSTFFRRFPLECSVPFPSGGVNLGLLYNHIPKTSSVVVKGWTLGPTVFWISCFHSSWFSFSFC